MTTVNVTVTLLEQDSSPVESALIKVKLTHTDVNAGYISGTQQTFTSDVNGQAVMPLWPNALGATASRYHVTAHHPTTGRKILDVMATIPDYDCNLSDVAELPAYPGKPEGGIAAAQAASSAAAAAASEANAATSETNAAGSATAAAASQTAAAASATAAATSATNAGASATAAAASATAAATSESNAATSETNAAGSETNAAASASAASTSETNAAAYATAASGSATSAATSAANASSSESAAATSASNAATSESNAASSAASAIAAYDSFDDRYLGPKASDPTLDNDGNALLDGALYWNTSVPEMRTYDLTNTVWVSSAYNSSNVAVTGGAVNGLTALSVAANSDSNASTWKMDTALSTADYWTKITEFTSSGTEVCRLTKQLLITAGQGVTATSKSAYCLLSLYLVETVADGLLTTHSSIEVLASNNNFIPFDGVKAVQGIAAGGEKIEVWVKSSIGSTLYSVTELSSAESGGVFAGGYINGSAWTATVPSGAAVITSDYAGSAGVVESGSNANGRYIKYADGTMACWQNGAVSAPDINTAVGAIYQSSADATWTFPAAFISTPTVTASRQAFTGVWIAGGTAVSTSTSASFRAMYKSAYASPVNFESVAVGRWK